MAWDRDGGGGAHPMTIADGPLPISVVVPARNAAGRIVTCLAAIRKSAPEEVILVDGNSTDGTRELARPFVDQIVIDAGTGPGAARQLGAEAASMGWIAFIDVDVDLPPDGLASMLAEVARRRLVGLQAGLRSVGEGDFWSEELAWHHNQGRSRGWFGVSASVLARDVVLHQPFDHRFRSGEDIDLRVRLERAGLPIAVSTSTVVTHHFAAGFGFALNQWLDDGAGLGRLVRKYGLRSVPHAFIPFVAAVVGWLRGWRHPLRHGAYFPRSASATSSG
jgi:glycosyltransferase involved in cell wall biosynthesis